MSQLPMASTMSIVSIPIAHDLYTKIEKITLGKATQLSRKNSQKKNHLLYVCDII